MRRAAGNSLLSWKRLALVNRTFQESLRRCSEALVIHRGGSLTKGPLKMRPLQGEEACAALSREIGARPRVKRLVLKADAKVVATHLPAILDHEARWISVEVDVPEPHFIKVVELLSKLEGSMRRLTIKVKQKVTGCLYQARSKIIAHLDIDNVVRAFPELEKLIIKGAYLLQVPATTRPGLDAEDSLSINLRSLTIREPGVWDLQQAMSYLPAQACATSAPCGCSARTPHSSLCTGSELSTPLSRL